jgi:hypothetical protein
MDPASGSIAWDRAWHLYMAGRYPEATTAIREARRFGQSGTLMTALILGASGRDDAAFAAWIERAREAGVAETALAAASRLPDRSARYRALAEAFRLKSPDRPVIVALLLMKAGDSAAAARELERARAGRSDWMAVWAPHMREFVALRNRQG